MSYPQISDWRAIVRRAAADALAFVLPIECAGCGEPDVELCSSCIRALAVPDAVRSPLGPSIEITSAFVFAGPVARMLRALKEDGRTELARAITPAARSLAERMYGHPLPLFVPMPTSRSAFVRRGYRVPEILLGRMKVPAARMLVPARATLDQRQLGRDERSANVAGSIRVRGQIAGSRVVIFDDVITTGATLREAVQTLQNAGAVVIGGLTIAATPLRRFGA